MKRITTTLASLALAATAAAHTSEIPHSHSDLGANWATVIFIAATMAAALFALGRMIKKARQSQ